MYMYVYEQRSALLHKRNLSSLKTPRDQMDMIDMIQRLKHFDNS